MAERKLIERLREVGIECDAWPYWMKRLGGIESRKGLAERREGILPWPRRLVVRGVIPQFDGARIRKRDERVGPKDRRQASIDTGALEDSFGLVAGNIVDKEEQS